MLNCNIWVLISFAYLVIGFMLGYVYTKQKIMKELKPIMSKLSYVVKKLKEEENEM